MRAGVLTKRILFERRKEHKNRFGEDELHWTPFIRAMAQVEEATGDRSVENRENIVSYAKTFTVRSYPGCLVNEDMRIRFEDRSYRINSILRRKDCTVIYGSYWNK